MVSVSSIFKDDDVTALSSEGEGGDAASPVSFVPISEETVEVVSREDNLVILRGLTGRIKPGASLKTEFGTGVLLASREPLGFALLRESSSSSSSSSSSPSSSKQATLLAERFKMPFAAEAAVGHVVGTFGERADAKTSEAASSGSFQATPPTSDEPGRELLTEFPDVNARQTVRASMRTGVASLDVLSPLGRGQSLLIMGPRESGINELANNVAVTTGKDTRTIYCATRGASTVEAFAQAASNDTTASTIIVAPREQNAHAGERYAAILTAISLAEDWRDSGVHVKLVIDDFSAMPRFFEYMLKTEREELGSAGIDSEAAEMVEIDGTLMSAVAAERRRFFGILMQSAAAMSEANGAGSLTLLPVLSLVDDAFVDGSPDAVLAALEDAPTGDSVAAQEARELATGKVKRKLPSREQIMAMSISEEQRTKLLAAVEAMEASSSSETSEAEGVDSSSAYNGTFTRSLAEELMSIADGQILLLPKRNKHRDGLAASYRPDVRNTVSRLGEDAAAPALRSIGISRVRLGMMQAWDSVDVLRMKGGNTNLQRLQNDFDRAATVYRALLDKRDAKLRSLSEIAMHLVISDALAEPAKWADEKSAADATAASATAILATNPASYDDLFDKAMACLDANVAKSVDETSKLTKEGKQAFMDAACSALSEKF